jgi:hypothetical protein
MSGRTSTFRLFEDTVTVVDSLIVGSVFERRFAVLGHPSVRTFEQPCLEEDRFVLSGSLSASNPEQMCESV